MTAVPARSTRAARDGDRDGHRPGRCQRPLTYEFDCDDDGTYESRSSPTTTRRAPSTTVRRPTARSTSGSPTRRRRGHRLVDVDVDNVAPTATFANGGSVNEGSTGSVSFSDQADPSAADDDGRLHLQLRLQQRRHASRSPTRPRPRATVPAAYLADGPGSRTVTGRITDKDGGFTDYTTTITVLNVAPTVTAVTAVPTGQRGQPDDGDRYGHRPGVANDPLTYAFDCDDDGTYEVGQQVAGNDATCTFDDGPATDRTVSPGDRRGRRRRHRLTSMSTSTTSRRRRRFANGGSVNEGSTGLGQLQRPGRPVSADDDGRLQLQLRLRQRRHLRDQPTQPRPGDRPGRLPGRRPGSRTVSGRITDKDGGFTDYTTTITSSTSPRRSPW